MLKSELIAKLNEIEGDFEVMIWDDDWYEWVETTDVEVAKNPITEKLNIELS